MASKPRISKGIWLVELPDGTSEVIKIWRPTTRDIYRVSRFGYPCFTSWRTVKRNGIRLIRKIDMGAQT